MILITGGAGFIGSNLLAYLSGHTKDDIAICDVLGHEDKWKNIAKQRFSYLISPSDLIAFVENYGTEIDCIFHLGAISTTTETDADLIIETNFTLPCTLWELAIAQDIRFIYASSAATYGDGSSGFMDQFEEKALACLQPLNPYGWSKHLFDQWVWREVHIHNRFPRQWAGLKFFNVYGPNEYHKGSQKSVIAALYSQIQSPGEAKLFKFYHPAYGHGEQMRDFVYVEDCIKIMAWLEKNPSISGLFNVGTGQARSFNDLAHAVFAALDQPPKLTYIDMPDSLRNAYQYHTQAKIHTLRHRGYTAPFISLEEGAKQYITCFLTHSDPYR